MLTSSILAAGDVLVGYGVPHLDTSAYGDGVTTVVLAVVAFVIGCFIGSFLNVVIWRVPNGISLVNPKRSFCPNCKSPIRWHDNIPVISYLVLHGKCRDCQEPISGRYPLVELLGGFMTMLAVLGPALHLYPVWLLPATIYFAWLSIVIAFIDIDVQLILDIMTYPSMLLILALLTLASWGAGSWTPLLRAVICAVALAAFYVLLGFIWPNGMGLGDAKLAVILGLILGWLGLRQLIVGASAAFIVGGVFALIQVARKRINMNGGVPFGPYMLIGAWIGIYVGAPIANWYLTICGLN